MLTLETDLGPKSFEAILFDMDGTMADSWPYHVEAWEKFASRLAPGRDVNAKLREFFGLNNRQILPHLVDRPMTLAEMDAFSEEKEALYREMARGRVLPVPGLMEFLQRVEAAGISLAVASSAIEPNVRFHIEQLGLEGRFGSVVHGGRVSRGKPDPETFLLAASELGVPPERCVVFEDSLHGLEGARRGGMISVGISLYGADGMAQWSDLVVKDFHGALARLRG